MFLQLTPLRCLHRAADLFGARIGVVCGQREFTYREFKARCERLATALSGLGIAPGDRVAYISFNNHQLLEGYFGVLQARAVLLPLNVRLAEPELATILEHAKPRIVIFEEEFLPLVERLRPLCSYVTHWVGIGCGDISYEELLAQGHEQHADITTCDELAIGELFYTSGSTGTPKGVMLSHRTLYLHALDYALQYRDASTMIDLHTIPLYHANGWGRPQASTMLGTKQVLVRRFHAEHVFRLIQTHRATDICLVPTMASALLDSAALSTFDLTSLRHVHIGGAASSPELVSRVERAFPGCECSSGYGLTETGPVLTHSEPKAAIRMPDAARYRRQSQTGWALPGVTLRVVDSHMLDVPRDGVTVGEVVAMGDHVMDGYFADPDATRAAFSGAWFHTGDMAVWEPDGYINIVDRKKQIIISGGENISSVEVETAIAEHPAVLECAVVAAPDEHWGEVPAAIVVVKEGQSMTAGELLEFLRPRLAKFKLPRIVEFSTEPLPKTGTGKVRKVELRERFKKVELRERFIKVELGERFKGPPPRQ
ncbi:MAG: long-chain-fatty-acid--CoA ligase [Acidobacteriota bacterium]